MKHSGADDSAFPHPGSTYEGLAKREWYAGMALVGMLARGWWNPSMPDPAGHLAKRCFEMADAMLRESAK